MSNVATDKLIRQYVSIRRMDVVLTHLRATLKQPAGLIHTSDFIYDQEFLLKKERGSQIYCLIVIFIYSFLLQKDFR